LGGLRSGAGQFPVSCINVLFTPYLCPSNFIKVATKFSKETYLYWYELMQLIRQFELMAEEKYKMEVRSVDFSMLILARKPLPLAV